MTQAERFDHLKRALERKDNVQYSENVRRRIMKHITLYKEAQNDKRDECLLNIIKEISTLAGPRLIYDEIFYFVTTVGKVNSAHLLRGILLYSNHYNEMKDVQKI